MDLARSFTAICRAITSPFICDEVNVCHWREHVSPPCDYTGENKVNLLQVQATKTEGGCVADKFDWTKVVAVVVSFMAVYWGTLSGRWYHRRSKRARRIRKEMEFNEKLKQEVEKKQWVVPFRANPFTSSN